MLGPPNFPVSFLKLPFYMVLGRTWVLAARVMLSQITESRLNFHHSKM